LAESTKVDQIEPLDSKPRWRELILYLCVGFGLFFLASLPLLFFVGGDLTEITLVITAAIGLINAVCFIGTFYLTGIRRGKISWASIGFLPPKIKAKWILVGVVVSLILIPVRALIGALVELAISGNLDSLKVRGDLLFAGAEPNIFNFLVSLLIIGVIVPVAEELFFRGLLYRWFQLRFRLWPAILLSSLLFGLAHYDSLAVMISSFVLGIANAIAMERTKAIWVPILMHAVTNSVAIFLMYFVLFWEQYVGR